MKTKNALKYVAAGLLGIGVCGCDAMWDSSVDIPLGYGGNVGVSVSSPIYGVPWYSGINSWSNWNNYPWGWNSGPIVRPIIRPIVPPLAPSPIRPGSRPPANNWRPPVNSTPSVPPPRPGNGNFKPGSSISRPPANANPPKLPVQSLSRPGRH